MMAGIYFKTMWGGEKSKEKYKTIGHKWIIVEVELVFILLFSLLL